MKIQCEIIRDLIPLLEDDVCSAQSRKAVLNHIQTCTACRRLYERSGIEPVFELQVSEAAVQRSIENGLRGIRKRWIASVLLVVLLLPLFLLTWGQIGGRGPAFTNLHEMWIARRFMSELGKGDFRAAFRHIDIAALEERWLDDWFEEEELEDMESNALRVFCDAASMLNEAGGIEDYRFLAVEMQGEACNVYYTVEISGREQSLKLNIGDGGIVRIGGSGSFIDDPLAHFCAWSEFLWEEYAGCVFDPQTGQYVYTD